MSDELQETGRVNFPKLGTPEDYLLPQHLTPTWKGCTPGPKLGESCLGSSGAADLRPGVLFHPQGLKKISAYMKSSRFLPGPLFLKLAVWGNK